MSFFAKPDWATNATNEFSGTITFRDTDLTFPKEKEYYPGEKPYRMVYVEDPFGIVFGIYSHSYELTYSAGAYQHES